MLNNFLKDEMQDTNAVQYEILRLIGSKYKNVFVVDDPLQNIFMCCAFVLVNIAMSLYSYPASEYSLIFAAIPSASADSFRYLSYDDEAFEYIYNRPNRWLGQAFIQEVRRLARREKISMYCAMFAVSKANWRYKNAVNNIYATIKTVGGRIYSKVSPLSS